MRNNNFKQNNNTNRTQKREAPKIASYTKKVDSFEEGLEALLAANPLIKEILNIKDDEDTSAITFEEANSRAFGAFEDNFPNMEENENTHWSLNLSANRCFLSTDLKVSFGWRRRFTKDRETKQITYSDYEISVSIYGADNDTDTVYVCNGWEKRGSK